MNPAKIHKRNWFFATSCVVLVSVSAPPAAAQDCCELSADPATATLPQENEYVTWSIAVDGATALAGAPDHNGGPLMPDSGRVIVFDFDDPSWVQAAVLKADDEFADDLFGWAVALDGDFALIGAPRDDDGGSDSGSAYIFQRVSGSWTQVAKLTASDADVGELFGWSVAINGDLAVIGAIFGDNATLDDVGAVYVFDRNDPNPDDWGQVEKLNASDGAADDWFGRSVSIDGPVIVVGAPLADQPAIQQGAAYIFRFDDPNWVEEAKLTALDASAADNFGQSPNRRQALGAETRMGTNRPIVMNGDRGANGALPRIRPAVARVRAEKPDFRMGPVAERFVVGRAAPAQRHPVAGGQILAPRIFESAEMLDDQWAVLGGLDHRTPRALVTAQGKLLMLRPV